MYSTIDRTDPNTWPPENGLDILVQYRVGDGAWFPFICRAFEYRNELVRAMNRRQLHAGNPAPPPMSGINDPVADLRWMYVPKPDESPGLFVIYNEDVSYANSEPMYWSNEAGWTSLAGATVFDFTPEYLPGDNSKLISLPPRY